MRTICAITANRADFSRIESILQALRKRDDVRLQLIVMGSHLLKENGGTIDEIRRGGFSIDCELPMEISGGTPLTMSKSVGLSIIELASALDRLQPDVVIAPVDRFESLAMGTAAALMNIHIAHIQGGEVTGTIDESIRHALTKLSHWHFVATEQSRERVIKMGEDPDTVFAVGCPATDLLLQAPAWDRATTLQQLKESVVIGSKSFTEEPYILMMQHPVTTEYGDASRQIAETVAALEGRSEQVIIFWPNIDAGSGHVTEIVRQFAQRSSRVHVFTHVSSATFVNIVRNAACQIGNSSSGIREACYFGTPVVDIGSRQSSRERGANVVNVDYDRQAIAAAINRQIAHGQYPVEPLYGDGTAGMQIAEILATHSLPALQKKITY